MVYRYGQRRASGALLLTGAVLILTCPECVLAGGYYGTSRVKGQNLRRERGLKLKSPKRNRLYQDDFASMDKTAGHPRGLQEELISKSRIGTFGNEQDPFFVSQWRNIGPYEVDDESSESDTNIQYRTSTEPPKPFEDTEFYELLEDLIDGRSANSSQTNSTTNSAVLTGELEVTTIPAPTPTGAPRSAQPATASVTIIYVSQAELAPAPTPPISVVEQAQEAGQAIVAGVTQNLAQGKKSKGAKNSKQGAAFKSKGAKYSVSSAFEAGGGGGKGGKGYGGSGVVSSAYGAGSGGGKGKSKGSKYGTYGSGTYVAPGIENPVVGEPVSAPIAPTLVAPTPIAPTPVISGVVGAPVPVPTATGPEYPPSQGTVAQQVNCEAIGQGTASTEGDRRLFQAKADWLLADGAEFNDVAVEVQNYLQNDVAPAIAGCEINRNRLRRLQFITAPALITNVLFDTPTTGGEGSCVIDQVERCYATESDVNMYFYGSEVGLGNRLLTFLDNAMYNVDGLLGVVNLKVFDSNGDEVGDDNNAAGNGDTVDSGDTENTGDSNGGSTSGENQGNTETENEPTNNQNTGGIDSLKTNDEGGDEEEGLSTWTKTLVGVAAATAFFGTLICFFLFRRCQSHANDDSQREGKIDLDSMPPEQPRSTGRFGEESTAGAVLADEQFSRTWPNDDDDDDDHSSNSEEDQDPVDDTQIQVTFNGDTHVCSSAYCEVCAQNEQRVQFISAGHQEPDDLPEDATRAYTVSDTVAL